MKRLLLLCFIIPFLFPEINAQTDAEYNSKGDQAVLRQDYLDACIWYGEGVDECNSYSIYQLTKLWDSQVSVRNNIQLLMSGCLTCIEKKAEAGDTENMFLLAEYYEKGIGTAVNTEKAEAWKARALKVYLGENTLGQVPTNIDTVQTITEAKIKIPEKKSFFSGFKYYLSYTPSITMPLGFSFGMLHEKKIGGYISARSNLNYQSSDLTYANGTISNYRPDCNLDWNEAKEKWNNFMITIGLNIPVIKNAFVSPGVGYATRNLYWYVPQYNNITEERISADWYRNVSGSYQGVALELNGGYHFNHIFFSAGINTVSFKDLDVSVGIGYVF